MYGSAGEDFLRTYGTLIIATYAVVQVWIIALWRRQRRGRLSIFRTGRLEVGYSNFGPTLAVFGTLRAQGKPVFVREIIVKLVKERDGSVHEFEWLFFRSRQAPSVLPGA